LLNSSFIEAKEKADLTFKVLTAGEDSKVLNNILIKIGKKAKIKNDWAVCGRKRALFCNNTYIIHSDESSVTNQEIRQIIKEKAKSVFWSMVEVKNKAKFSKVYQNSKSILLNDEAFAVSKPQLKIFIDELEASHGSTIGNIGEEELFYLKSRGIEEKIAKKMIILSFIKEIFKDEIDTEKMLKEFFDEQKKHTR